MGASRPWTAEHHLRRVYRDDVCSICCTLGVKQNRLTIFRHIAGFRDPAPLDPEHKFTDMTFVDWGLAIPPSNAGWEKDSTKWAW